MNRPSRSDQGDGPSNEAELRFALKAGHIGTWSLDLATSELITSAACRVNFGRDADRAFSYAELRDAVHPDDQARMRQAVEHSIATREEYNIEYRLLTPAGEVRWAHIRAQPSYHADGTPKGLFGVSMDITARRRAEGRLRELNESLESQVAVRTGERNQLWELSRDLIMRCRLDGEILSVNPAWSELLGWRETDLIGVPVFLFLHQDDVDAATQASRTLTAGGSHPNVENRIFHRDGSIRWISWSSRRVDDVLLSVGRDITAEKAAAAALARTEEALRQAQKMEAVGQLTGGLAHDFNNMLAGISGALELMSLRISQGRLHEIDRYLLAAQGATRRATALTHRLLAFARRQTLLPKLVNVNRMVIDLLDLIRRTVGAAIKVEHAPAVDLWPTLVDPSQLENALLNLCINARDAMPGGGRLKIETVNRSLDSTAAGTLQMSVGEYVCLSVRDTGTGMPADVIEKAFDPFFTTKPIGEGTGLGLSMIYGFAKQSGGQVRIDSEVGRGTVVCLYLPRHSGPLEIDDVAPGPSPPVAAPLGETVLVVDDEPTVRLLVGDVLEELGYSVIEAGDSAAGMRVLESDVRLDLLISDVGLPGGMNGRQMAEVARRRRPELRVLLITGYADSSVLNVGSLESDMAVLPKPFTIDALASQVRALLGSL